MFKALWICVAGAVVIAVAFVGSPSDTAFAAGEPACAVFPADNPWNTDISNLPLDPRSDAYVESVGRADHLHPDFGTVWDGAPTGIPYTIVPGSQPRVAVSFDYADESDPGPYPVPPDATIEGGPDGSGDRHVLVIDNDNCVLYEMFDAHPVNGGQSWTAGSGAVFNLNSNALRPDFWTSADAAGLPIFPGLVRYEEVVEQGVIDHALRFTVSTSQRAFIHPATHYASNNTDPNVPPMGLRFRMKASYDCAGYSVEVRVICTALKKYGMFVADNGSDWYISGAPDPRWSDDRLGDLKRITGDAFEVVSDQPGGGGDGGPPPEPQPAPPPAPEPGQAPEPSTGGDGTTAAVANPAPEPTATPSPGPSASPEGTRTLETTAASTPGRSVETSGDGSARTGASAGIAGIAVLVIGGGAAGGAYYLRRRRRA